MTADALIRISNLAEKEFGSLSEAQLNAKPASDRWSIAQCLDHLIASNSKYVPMLKACLKAGHKKSIWEKYNPLTNYTGKQMIKTLGPEVKQKYKAPQLFRPAGKTIEPGIVKRFILHQKELSEMFSILEQENFSSMVISSPVSGLITLKVHDVLSIIIVHEERHLNQALGVKQIILETGN